MDKAKFLNLPPLCSNSATAQDLAMVDFFSGAGNVHQEFRLGPQKCAEIEIQGLVLARGVN